NPADMEDQNRELKGSATSVRGETPVVHERSSCGHLHSSWHPRDGPDTLLEGYG
ncbi:hypothetical protein PISMIDRAFT_674957, partial [Pisolithus microcarpus 441]